MLEATHRVMTELWADIYNGHPHPGTWEIVPACQNRHEVCNSFTLVRVVLRFNNSSTP
jgi:hypothetical protein